MSPLWQPKYEGSGVSARCAVQPSVYGSKVAAPLPGCCEFATGVITEACSGRNCGVHGCYCPPSVFRDPKVFGDCSTRKEKLAAVAEQS